MTLLELSISMTTWGGSDLGGAGLVFQEGFGMVGISAGAAVQAAIELAKRSENEGKMIVVIIISASPFLCISSSKAKFFTDI